MQASIRHRNRIIFSKSSTTTLNNGLSWTKYNVPARPLRPVDHVLSRKSFASMRLAVQNVRSNGSIIKKVVEFVSFVDMGYAHDNNCPLQLSQRCLRKIVRNEKSQHSRFEHEPQIFTQSNTKSDQKSLCGVCTANKVLERTSDKARVRQIRLTLSYLVTTTETRMHGKGKGRKVSML